VRYNLLGDKSWPIEDEYIDDPLFETADDDVDDQEPLEGSRCHPHQQQLLHHRQQQPTPVQDAAFNDFAVLDEDDEDEPLFAPPKSGSGSGTARHSSAIMNTSSAPININSARWPGSTPSPRNQASTLTSALQEAGGATTLTQPGSVDFGNGLGSAILDGGRGDTMMMGSSYLGSGALPISVQNRNRRESNTGSFINGMSWGPGSLPSSSWVNE
jgi:hypothetical protein